MCDAMPGWRRRILAGGLHPVGVTDAPPAGSVRLAVSERPVIGGHEGDRRPKAGGIFAFLVSVCAALVSLQALVPWAPWRAVLQEAGVLVMFTGLGIWARLTRHAVAAHQRCSCDRPPVWIRIIPSVAQVRHAPSVGVHEAGAVGPVADAALVEMNGVRRS